MVTQVLIVHGQLPFAITLKQTLERGAPFEAHPFTSAEAAAEYLRDHVQDVALVDFTMPDFAGEQIVQLLREIQPSLAIIATPRQDDEVLRDLDLQASLKTGFAARDLIALINAYFADHQHASYVPPKTTGLLERIQQQQNRPDPNRTAQLPESPPPSTEHSSLDRVLSSSAGGTNLFDDALFEPGEGDTPASSVEDIAWAHEPPRHDSSFDEVLNALPPDASSQSAPSSPFSELVNSMRNEATHRPLPSRQEQFVEFILSSGMDSLIEDSDEGQAGNLPVEQASAESTFEKLAQEEPPPPTFEESGTVSDLVTGFQDRSFRNVLSILRGEEVQDSEPVLPPAPDVERSERSEAIPQLTQQQYFDDTSTPARVILQRTLEESALGNDFSLEELLKSIEEQFPQHSGRVLPLPAWLAEQQGREDAFMIREPDFLPEELPPEPTPSEDLYPNQTTQPARGQQIEAHPEALETDWIEKPVPVAEETASSLPTTLPEEIPAEATVLHEATTLHDPTIATDMWHDLPSQDFNTQFEMMAAFEVHDEKGVSAGALYTEMPVEQPLYPAEWGDEPAAAPPQTPPPEPVIKPIKPPAPPSPTAAAVPGEDPYLAQLALSLTEVSLELTAEATLLARDGQIVAFAGRMQRAEIEELRGAIADDWNAAPGEVRIRFLTSRGSGKDYMLYSRRTEDDFTLSLIFAGTTPLRDIRRQGQRLVNALSEVPETADVREQTVRRQAAKPETTAPPVDTGTRTPYACVWLLRDPTIRLDPAVSQAITAGLNIQMQEKHWHIQNLEVRDDHVYLLAEVPGEDPAFKIVRDLKRRAAELAHAQNPAYPAERLWSDGYLVVTPGRELDAEEIQQFIDFERMD